jgi:excisionase family DNA binding protein
MSMTKIKQSHLERAAHIYIRQSKPEQVQNNVESRRRQYGLTERARQLGFRDVHVIDDDLGRSGAGHVDRQGFEALLAAVCQGQVGAVFVVDASRLARNGHEWHRLLEFCGIVDALIIDHDGVYDPKHPNDRLLLGLKGMMSEMETATFRQRSQEAIQQMARRGEYYTRIPEGYVLRDARRLEKDPDEQVRCAIELVFTKFRELGSARQVSLWLRQEQVPVPRRRSPLAGPVDFVPATTWRITGLLKNPAYAGAYAFGRTRRRTVLIEGRKRQVKQRQQRPDQWQVLLQDHHEGYITWMEYLANQERLEQNRNALGEAVSGAARPGKGLLAGLVRCGHCGRKMRVRYSGRRGRDSLVVYYYCVAAECETVGKQICHIFGGVALEQAVVEAVLDVLAPARMEAMLEAAAELTARRTEKQRQVEMELERARYEADRCARQYGQVEPENRLVARTLETRWNEAMDRVRVLEQQCAQLSDGQELAAAKEQEPLRRLALDLPRLWHHPSAPFDLKKRILRTVVKEVVVYVEESRLRVLIHWQGGQHSELSLRKRRTGQHRWTTSVETLNLIRQLARRMSDKQIAAQMNRLGIRTAKGHTWTRTRVGNFRTIHEIPNYSPGEREARDELTLEEAAARLGVSYSTMQRLIQRRRVPAQQVCPGGPWTLRAEDVETFRIQNGARQSPKRRPSSPHRDQRTLEFPEDI